MPFRVWSTRLSTCSPVRGERDLDGCVACRHRSHGAPAKCVNQQQPVAGGASADSAHIALTYFFGARAAGIRDDYVVRQYLWTGDIDARLYAAHCEFTDPTLSFRGLATFQRNLAALRPIVRRLAYDTVVELESAELMPAADAASGGAIVARWRMAGRFRLPWRPQLDVRGTTRFELGPRACGGRIERYKESWALPPAAALAQLLRPAPR